MSATTFQVDGTHYTKMKIQPMMLASQLNASPCFVKVAKYITRNKDDMFLQLDKAFHVVLLEQELRGDDDFYGMTLDPEGHYTMIEVPDVGEKIKAFAGQFLHAEYIHNILRDMFNRDYCEAKQEIRHLRQRYMKGNL